MYNKPNFKRYIFGVDDAAAIGAAASVIGAGTSAAAQASMNKKTREFNREEAEKQRNWSEKMYNEQNAWNYQMWQEEKAYNTPAAQVERLREAGLNPMFYGLDGNSVGSAADAAQPLGYERASADNQPNPFAGFGDIATKVAQIANIQADTAKKNNENISVTAQREKTMAEIDSIKQEIQNKIATEKLTDKQREKLDKDIAWLDRLNEAALASQEAETALKQTEKKRIEELLEGEKLIQAKTIEDFEHKWAKIRAEISKMAKETGLLEKDIENYALNHAQSGFMGTGLSIPNLIRSGAMTGKNKSADTQEAEADAMAAIVGNKY